MKRVNILRQVTLLAVLGASAVIALSASANTVNMKLDARVRGEAMSNLTFVKTTEFDQLSSRFRLHMSVNTDDNTTIVFQPQFTLNPWTANPTPGNDDPNMSSVHQAYIAHKFSDSYSVIVGRGELNYGDGLIVSKEAWDNVGRTFDSFLVKAKWGMAHVDWIYAKMNDAGAEDDSVFGFYATMAFGDAVKEFDVYHLIATLGTTLADDDGTVSGVRVKSNHGAFDYTVEYASQSNDLLTDNDSMADLDLGWEVNAANKIRVNLGYTMASKMYNSLASSQNIGLGIANQFSRNNINDVNLGVTGMFADKYKAGFAYHMFTRNDNAVASSGGQNSASTSDDVAKEIDLTVSTDLTKGYNLALGYASVTPDKFLEDAGMTEAFSYAYFQFTATY